MRLIQITDFCHNLPLFYFCFVFLATWALSKLGNGKVREFLLIILLALPRPGRVEEGINKFSPHLAPHFKSMYMRQNLGFTSSHKIILNETQLCLHSFISCRSCKNIVQLKVIEVTALENVMPPTTPVRTFIQVLQIRFFQIPQGRYAKESTRARFFLV